jgi:ribosomal protein S12
MKIESTSSVAVQRAIALAARAAGANPDRPVSAVRRIDRVRISAEGRALIAPSGAGDTELTPEQIAEIRRRIQAGVYNSLHVVNEVARRILARGDLGRPL